MTLDQVFASLANNVTQLAQGLADMQGEIARLNAANTSLQARLDTPFETTTEQQVIVNRVNELSGVIASQVPHA